MVKVIQSKVDWIKCKTWQCTFEKRNLRRHGCKAYARYEAYKSAMTIGQAMSSGATIQDLDVDLLKGSIVVRHPDTGVLVEYTDHPAALDHAPEQLRKDVKDMVLLGPGDNCNNCTDQSTQTDENWVELP